VEFWDGLGEQDHPLRATISELNEQLPEVGDAEKPKLLMSFDAAHLLFAGAPPVLVDRCWLKKVEQVVRALVVPPESLVGP
jgi:DNA helicase HerA-like ATPase